MKNSRKKSSARKIPRSCSSPFVEWDIVPNPPRVSRQVDQELISKSALATWFHRHEWKPNKPEIDLGQDLWVDIYENQRTTGLTINVQHKSAEDINSYKLKTSFHISYPLEVKDLIHWTKQLVPVLLVICDVRCEADRYWIFIDDIIEELEKTDEAWFRQKSINVLIPLSNYLTTAALLKIRHRLADHFFPVLAKKYKEIKIGLRLNFPPTSEGQNKRVAFAKFLETGQPVTIEKEYITDIRLSDWHEQLYGRQIPDSLTFGPSNSKATYHFRMEVYPLDGSVVPAQVLELRLLQGGKHEITLSNVSQNNPILFTFTLMNYPDRQFVQVNFKMVHAGSTVFETRDALLFLIAVAEGGQIQLIESNSGKAVSAGSIATDENFSIEQLKAQAGLVTKLCFLQSKFHFSPVLSVQGKYLTDDDYYQVDKLYTICQTGLFSGLQNITITYDGVKRSENASKQETSLSEGIKQGLELEVTIPEHITVLGRQIELGNVRSCAKFTVEQTYSYQEQLREGMKKKSTRIKMCVQNVFMSFMYLNWEKTKNQFGFNLTLKQPSLTGKSNRKRKP